MKCSCDTVVLCASCIGTKTCKRLVTHKTQGHCWRRKRADKTQNTVCHDESLFVRLAWDWLGVMMLSWMHRRMCMNTKGDIASYHPYRMVLRYSCGAEAEWLHQNVCRSHKTQQSSKGRKVRPVASVGESLAKLRGSKIFTKLDTNGGFYQVPLDQKSKLLTAFITPFWEIGRYCFSGLAMDFSSMCVCYIILQSWTKQKKFANN